MRFRSLYVFLFVVAMTLCLSLFRREVIKFDYCKVCGKTREQVHRRFLASRSVETIREYETYYCLVRKWLRGDHPDHIWQEAGSGPGRVLLSDILRDSPPYSEEGRELLLRLKMLDSRAAATVFDKLDINNYNICVNDPIIISFLRLEPEATPQRIDHWMDNYNGLYGFK